jgi:hypothetical protein
MIIIKRCVYLQSISLHSSPIKFVNDGTLEKLFVLAKDPVRSFNKSKFTVDCRSQKQMHWFKSKLLLSLERNTNYRMKVF